MTKQVNKNNTCTMFEEFKINFIYKHLENLPLRKEETLNFPLSSSFTPIHGLILPLHTDERKSRIVTIPTVKIHEREQPLFRYRSLRPFSPRCTQVEYGVHSNDNMWRHLLRRNIRRVDTFTLLRKVPFGFFYPYKYRLKTNWSKRY